MHNRYSVNDTMTAIIQLHNYAMCTVNERGPTLDIFVDVIPNPCGIFT